jgi:hypothetical protein
MYPDELINIELECIFLGLMFNNPKAISRFYFKYEDCRFSDDELTNLYKIVIFRDGEAYAPAIAKDKYQLPRETPNTYDLRMKVRKIAASGDYNLEHVYTELKKLFILKKNYVVAPYYNSANDYFRFFMRTENSKTYVCSRIGSDNIAGVRSATFTFWYTK